MNLKINRATFIKKYNRFLCAIEIDGVTWDCHIPNTGRLGELLYPGNTVGVRYVAHPNRKTSYEVVLAEKNGDWYCIDSRIPNQLVKEWAVGDFVKEWQSCMLTAEKTFGNSRFDFKIDGLLTGYIEVKGVTLEREGRGYFPDAPTLRGRKHLEELIEVKRQGMYAAVVFVCECERIQSFSPNDVTDPEFGTALRKLAAEGVRIMALQAIVTENAIEWGGEIPVIL